MQIRLLRETGSDKGNIRFFPSASDVEQKWPEKTESHSKNSHFSPLEWSFSSCTAQPRLGPFPLLSFLQDVWRKVALNTLLHVVQPRSSMCKDSWFPLPVPIPFSPTIIPQHALAAKQLCTRIGAVLKWLTTGRGKQVTAYWSDVAQALHLVWLR